MKKSSFRFFFRLIISVCLVFLIILLYKKNSKVNNKLEKNNASNPKSDELTDIHTISQYNNPIIPKGFQKVETENASWEKDEIGNIKGWNNGLVIEDGIGNQFVWIPVRDFNSFSKKDGYYEGQKQEFINYCYEANYINQTIESKELYESIQKYQGFYMARFEAGIEDVSKIPIQNGTIQPVSKKNSYVWTNIRWGSPYDYALDGIQGSDTKHGAVKVARSMYPNVNKLIEYQLPTNLSNDTGVISTLCYGIQWDLTMDFISDVDNPYTNTKFIEDSTNMGYFANTSHNQIQLTGTDIDEKASNSIKNIYDLAGNVNEWTMEAYKNRYRIYRGGMYEMGNVKPSASMRSYATPDGYEGYEDNRFVGFRVTLYLI